LSSSDELEAWTWEDYIEYDPDGTSPHGLTPDHNISHFRVLSSDALLPNVDAFPNEVDTTWSDCDTSNQSSLSVLSNSVFIQQPSYGDLGRPTSTIFESRDSPGHKALELDSSSASSFTTWEPASVSSFPQFGQTTGLTAYVSHNSNRTQLLEPARRYTCPQPHCKYSSVDKARLAQHSNRHGELRCDVGGCSRKQPFDSPKDLKRHISAVHGPRTLLPCGKRLGIRKDNLQRHQNKCRANCKDSGST